MHMQWQITPMQVALTLSVGLHVGLLAFKIADPQGFDRLMMQSPLEIVLVNGRSPGPAPEKPQALAQAHLQGGGEAASGRTIAYQIKPRRPGDIAECWAEPHKARDELGWQAERGLEQMMVDTWRWQSNNPNGYQS